VVTAVTTGLVTIPGACVVAAAKADDASGDVEQPLTPTANPASPNKNAQQRVNAVNAIKRPERKMSSIWDRALPRDAHL